ncbi:hypothetical protein JHK84_043180 [Glycine max]|nr:hypothetical protein JHK84_043180 [Glycine max]
MPLLVRVPPSGYSWKDVCGGGYGFAMAISDQASALGEQRRSESMDNIDFSLPQSYSNSQVRVVPFPNEVTDATSMMDGSGIMLEIEITQLL